MDKENNNIDLNKKDPTVADPNQEEVVKDETIPADENVSVPQPEEPASVLEPDVSAESVKRAVEFGPEEPKKKGFAWLWALIGIAVVLAVVGMLVLRNGEKDASDTAKDNAEPAVEEVVADSALASDSAAMEIGAQTEEATVTTEGTPVAEATPQTSSADTQAVESKTPVEESKASVPASSEVETEAVNVIHGDYGNGDVRRERLGARYNEIQSRVNQLKRAGKF